MEKFTISKEITFDMAHRVPLHDSKCKRLHGHTYRLIVTVSGEKLRSEGSETGMVMDFSKLKGVMEDVKEVFDHGTTLSKDDPLLQNWFTENAKNMVASYGRMPNLWPLVLVGDTYFTQPIGKLTVIDGPPTAEVLAQIIWKMCRYRDVVFNVDNAKVEDVLDIDSVTLYETPTSWAVYSEQ